MAKGKKQTMSQTSYNYEQRTGIRPISWQDFHGICKALACAVFSYQPEMIIAVGRGGYYPGTLLAHLLQTEIYPVRLSRRINDVVTYDTPRWLLEPTTLVAGKRVLVVDEICSTGETLLVVKAKVEALGAQMVKLAVMYAHSWSVAVPDYIGLVSDELLLNPWDREVLGVDGFHFHPEYAAGLAQQGIPPTADLLIQATTVQLAKE
jgi:hypoxanthine phosphoribosyltransferase